MSTLPRASTFLITLAVWSLTSVAAEPAHRRAETQPAPAIDTLIRVARSDDGLAFWDAGEIFALHASAPDLVRLPNNDLLAVFDWRERPDKPIVLAVSRSRDEGVSWSEPKAVVIQGGSDSESARHADLVLDSSGAVRMFYCAQLPGGERRARPSGVTVRAAVSRNGWEYRVDPECRIPCERLRDAHPTGAWLGSSLDLYVATMGEGGPERPCFVQRFSSRDGRRFRPAERTRMPGLFGNIIGQGRGLRAFVTGRNEVQSIVSTGTSRWSPEEGVRLKDASDPAVVELRGNKYLMLYCAPAADLTKEQAGKVLAGGNRSLRSGSTPDSGTVAPEPGQADSPIAADWEPFTEAEPAMETGGGETEATAAEFAPKANLDQPVNYVDWLQATYVPAAGDNAFEAYEAVRRLLDATEEANPQPAGRSVLWDRLNGDAPVELPAPWMPADHPDWENSYQLTQGVFDLFKAAARDGRQYAAPIPAEEQAGPPDMFMKLMLPSLAMNRGLCKGTLAQAWRTPTGVVPPEQMTEAWETVLDNVQHLREGYTLIESLVGLAEQNLAEDEARWALRQGVFTTPQQIESALQTLREHDYPPPDASRWIASEHALFMDTTQRLFDFSQPDGKPRVREIPLETFLSLSGGKPEQIEALKTMSREDVEQATEIADSLCRETAEKWSIGYPQVRAEDIEELTVSRTKGNPLTRLMTAKLGRVYEIEHRVEASRRATQLAFGVELYRARYGRYPASLDELPEDCAADMRTDPFTGRDFGYQLTAEGPRIYTLSLNGVDDGGVHSRNWADKATQTGGSDDHVFWPPPQ
jgi:hypothetical protein